MSPAAITNRDKIRRMFQFEPAVDCRVQSILAVAIAHGAHVSIEGVYRIRAKIQGA